MQLGFLNNKNGKIKGVLPEARLGMAETWEFKKSFDTFISMKLKNMALSDIFCHPSTRAIFLGLTGGLTPKTPFRDHIEPKLE